MAAGRNESGWSLVSSQGAALFYIAVNPGCTIGEIAEATARTRRGVWANVNCLRRAGMLHVALRGRNQCYTVNLDAPFFHPSLKGYTLRPFLEGLMAEHLRRRTLGLSAREPQADVAVAVRA